MNQQILNLAQTQLETIPEGLLHSLRSLQVLILNGNQLTTVPVELQRAPNLAFLNLNDNPIKKLDSTSFQGLSSLQQLNISAMDRLESIEEKTFSPLHSLRELYCSFNPSLRKIHSKAFMGILKQDEEFTFRQVTTWFILQPIDNSWKPLLAFKCKAIERSVRPQIDENWRPSLGVSVHFRPNALPYRVAHLKEFEWIIKSILTIQLIPPKVSFSRQRRVVHPAGAASMGPAGRDQRAGQSIHLRLQLRVDDQSIDSVPRGQMARSDIESDVSAAPHWLQSAVNSAVNQVIHYENNQIPVKFMRINRQLQMFGSWEIQRQSHRFTGERTGHPELHGSGGIGGNYSAHLEDELQQRIQRQSHDHLHVRHLGGHRRRRGHGPHGRPVIHFMQMYANFSFA